MEDLIRETFFLGVDMEKTFGKEGAEKRVANVASLIEHFVERFKDREIYNAYKHSSLDFKHATYGPGGLAFNGLSLLDSRRNGMSTFKYPTDEDLQSGEFEVKEIVTLLAPDCSAAETLVVTHLLQNMIEARKFGLNLSTQEDYRKAFMPFNHGAEAFLQTGIHTQTFSIIDRFTRKPPSDQGDDVSQVGVPADGRQ